MNERVALRMKANADNFLVERNQQRKMLDQAMKGLELEKNYIFKHMDMDKKVFEKRYQRLQTQAGKIKSNLTPRQIARLRKKELGYEVESSSSEDDASFAERVFMTEQDVQIVDVGDAEADNINKVSDENNNLINNNIEAIVKAMADDKLTENINNNHPIVPIIEETTSIPQPKIQNKGNQIPKKTSARRKDSGKRQKQSSAKEHQGTLAPAIRETKVKIVEPSEEAAYQVNNDVGAVVKLPSTGNIKLKSALKLRRSQSMVDLEQTGDSSSQLSNSLPAIPLARGLSQPAPGNKSGKKIRRSSTADPLNWTYTSGVYSCHNSRKSTDYSTSGEKLNTSSLNTGLDFEREDLRTLLEKEKTLNQVLIKKRKNTLFKNIEETIASTNGPPMTKSTPDLLDEEERPQSAGSGRLVSRASSHTDSNITEDLDYLREEIRRRKTERFYNRDRRSSKLNLFERKEGEKDEDYDKRIAAWRKDMKKCRYLRNSIDLSGVQTLVMNQHKLQNIWQSGIKNNLFN